MTLQLKSSTATKIRPEHLRDEPRAGDGGFAAATALSPKPPTGAERPKDKPPNELGEVIKTFPRCGLLAVGQNPRRRTADEAGQGLSRFVGLVGAPPGRANGIAGDRAIAARQTLQRSGMAIEPVL